MTNHKNKSFKSFEEIASYVGAEFLKKNSLYVHDFDSYITGNFSAPFRVTGYLSGIRK